MHAALKRNAEMARSRVSGRKAMLKFESVRITSGDLDYVRMGIFVAGFVQASVAIR